jgi:hypothetical protein
MLKMINVISVILFAMVVSMTPTLSVKDIELTLTQDAQESTSLTSSSFEEEIVHTEKLDFFMNFVSVDYPFSMHLCLKSQEVITEILKPPLA